ncbi:MAG: MFS transporter, partial [Gammaproteobacteria bacterium]|nr:MFS transporter [Gammaproteobacteria bacterium]
MRVFSGWWVLLGLFLIYTANNGILINTLPLFYPELIKEFGWNEEQVTRPATLFFIVAAVLTPFIGALFDRFSTRLIMVIGILAVAAALIVYPQVKSLGQLTAVYMVFALGLAGAGLVPNMLILTRWFRRYRGIAVGILLMGSSIGGALFPLIARNTFVNQGWREAVMLVAIVGTVMMLASIVLLVRNRPEDKGLAPDGDAVAPAEVDAPTAAPGMTLGQAARTPAFYLLMFATGGMWFCIVGVIQHQAIFLGQDLGVSDAVLPVVLSVFFCSAVAGKLLFGYLGDRFNKTFIM